MINFRCAFVVGLMVFCGVASGEERRDQTVDPNDIWYRGFMKVKSADESLQKGETLKALNFLDEAFDLYKSLRLHHPEYHTEVVKNRLHLIVEKRSDVKGALRDSSAKPAEEEPGGAEEIEAVEKQIRELQEQQKALEKRLEGLKKKLESAGIEMPTRLLDEADDNVDFQDRLDDIEKKMFSGNPGIADLFPKKDWFTLKDENGTGLKVEAVEVPTTPKVPENWIPRMYEGQMTYFIPLIETPETRAFTRREMVPAATRNSK